MSNKTKRRISQGKPMLPATFLIAEGLEEMKLTTQSVEKPARRGVALRGDTPWIDSIGRVRRTDPLFEAEADGYTFPLIEMGRMFGKSTADVVREIVKEDLRYLTWDSFDDDLDMEDDESLFPPSYDSLYYHQFNPTVIRGHAYGD